MSDQPTATKERFSRLFLVSIIGNVIALIFVPIVTFLQIGIPKVMNAPDLKIEFVESASNEVGFSFSDKIHEHLMNEWGNLYNSGYFSEWCFLEYRQNDVGNTCLNDLIFSANVYIEYLKRNGNELESLMNYYSNPQETPMPYISNINTMNIFFGILSSYSFSVSTALEKFETYSPVMMTNMKNQIAGAIRKNKETLSSHEELVRQASTQLKSTDTGKRVGEVVFSVGVINSGNSDTLILPQASITYAGNNISIRQIRYYHMKNGFSDTTPVYNLVKANSFSQVIYYLDETNTPQSALEPLRKAIINNHQDEFKITIKSSSGEHQGNGYLVVNAVSFKERYRQRYDANLVQ